MDETNRVERDRVQELLEDVDSLPTVMDFDDWLRIMEKLQQVAYGAYYDTFDNEERADSLRMNLFALTSEVVEMGQEVGWKPWSSPQGWVNKEALIGEAVDAMHFLANLLKHADCHPRELTAAYKIKLRKNVQRQLDGYNVIDAKCPRCHRDLSEVSRINLYQSADGIRYCSKECSDD